MPGTFRSALPYFGSTHLWSQALAAGGFAFRQNENYQRRTQRNRTVIANSHGRQTLSIPLLGGKHQSCPITEARISYQEDWQRQHWLSISAAYGSAPFYHAYADELQDLFSRKLETLRDWNWQTVDWLRNSFAPWLELTVVEDWLPEIDAQPVSLAPDATLAEYPQVFSERIGWQSNLSLLDLVFCQGPTGMALLMPPQ